jgi:hypothetical protein
MSWQRSGILVSLLAVAVTVVLAVPMATPSKADNCSGNPAPCSPRCVRLGNLYDHRNQAVERVYRKLASNTRQLNAALKQKPINETRVRRLERKDSYLRKLYHRRHVRLMRTYRKLLATCF